MSSKVVRLVSNFESFGRNLLIVHSAVWILFYLRILANRRFGVLNSGYGNSPLWFSTKFCHEIDSCFLAWFVMFFVYSLCNVFCLQPVWCWLNCLAFGVIYISECWKKDFTNSETETASLSSCVACFNNFLVSSSGSILGKACTTNIVALSVWNRFSMMIVEHSGIFCLDRRVGWQEFGRRQFLKFVLMLFGGLRWGSEVCFCFLVFVWTQWGLKLCASGTDSSLAVGQPGVWVTARSLLHVRNTSVYWRLASRFKPKIQRKTLVFQSSGTIWFPKEMGLVPNPT